MAKLVTMMAAYAKAPHGENDVKAPGRTAANPIAVTASAANAPPTIDSQAADRVTGREWKKRMCCSLKALENGAVPTGNAIASSTPMQMASSPWPRSEERRVGKECRSRGSAV